MRVEYKKSVLDKIIDATSVAMRDNRTIECVYLSDEEWNELRVSLRGLNRWNYADDLGGAGDRRNQVVSVKMLVCGVRVELEPDVKLEGMRR